MFHSLLARRTSPTKPGRSSRRQERHRAFQWLAVELLEERWLLSVDFVYSEPFADGVILRTVSTALPLQSPVVSQQGNQESPFRIELQKSPELLANPEASAAWDLAASIVESYFFDPVTIIIDADVSVLPEGVLAQASSVPVAIDYMELRSLLIADASEDETLPAQLPTLDQADVILPEDLFNPFTLVGAAANRATLKALGVAENTLPGPASEFNPSVIRDMSISFSSEFPFDYDPTDGITPGTWDFVGVAIHEIFHGLGFTSSINHVDFALDNPEITREIRIGPLDLFRLRPGAGAVDFTTSPRVLTPEGDSVFYDGVYEPVGFPIPDLTTGDVPLSTGASNGDGWQAGHWKNQQLTGVYIGIMNPTIASGTLGIVTDEDLRTLGLIGYDLTQPVPPVVLNVSGFEGLEGDEGLTDFVFTVTASNETIEPYTVAYATFDGTATVADNDYLPTAGVLTFLPGGPLVQTITVQVVGDLKVEPDETFFVRLFDATSPASLGVAEAVGLIINDDYEISIGDVAVVEGHIGTRNAVFPVTVIGAIPPAFPLSYTTVNGTADGGKDYIPAAGNLVLTPQNPAAFITVPIIGDRLNEGDETFYVVLFGSPAHRIVKSIGVGTIIDDDPLPSLYVGDVAVTSTQADLHFAEFAVALDAPSGRQVSVEYATVAVTAVPGVDYVEQSGMLTFAPGVTHLLVTVPIMTSGVAAANKTFKLQLSNPTHANVGASQGSGTIVFADNTDNEFILDNGNAGYAQSNNGWTVLTNTLAYGLDYAHAAPGNGNTAATWSFTAIPNGTYEVFARWIPFSNRATNAPYTILDRDTPVGTVLVNQQLAPTGDYSDGVHWQSLGMFETTSNTLRVRLNNNANGYVIADAIRIVGDGVGQQSAEIDISGFGHSITTGDSTPSAADGTDFGTVASLGISVTRTFTIANNGNANLNLTGNPLVSIGGPHPDDFTVMTQPAAIVGPGAATTFQIVFRPTELGVRHAVVSIANDDSDENPYTFLIQGTGGQAAATPLAHNHDFPQDVNGDGRITPTDVLIVINTILASSSQAAPLTVGESTGAHYPDVNGDGRITPADALMVINYLLAPPAAAPLAAPLAEPSAAEPLAAAAVDRAFVLLDVADEPPADATPWVDAAPRVELGRRSSDAAGPVSSATPLLWTPEDLAADFVADEESADAAFAEADLELAFLDD